MELQSIFPVEKKKNSDVASVVAEILAHSEAAIKEFSYTYQEGRILRTTRTNFASALEQGGVIHYQRNLNQTTQKVFFEQVLLDLFWIEETFGEIERIQSFYRGNEFHTSAQLFVTLRLKNRLIVEYGLNSLVDMPASFRLDISTKGQNIEYDTRDNRPVMLNGVSLSPQEEVKETMTETQLPCFKNLVLNFAKSIKKEES